MSCNTIRVGILQSLTGTMALSEKPLVDASLMAIAEINERGGVLGKLIDPVIEDGTSNPEVFRQKAEKLILQDQVATVFGCWTSLSRKAVLPVFEQHNNLLWYPVQYEGLEQSRNIFYTGSCPNQQVSPAVDWLLAQNRKRFYLLGSDYVFPRTVNKIVKGQLRHHHGVYLGEAYVELGGTDFRAIVQDIQRAQPDVVFSTLNGDSNLAFYQQYQAAGLTANTIPIMAVSVSEVILQRLHDLAVGHFASWSYFQSLETGKNREFVRAFQQRYGSDRVTSDPIETAYSQVYLWYQAASLAKSVEVDAVRHTAYGQAFESPGGWVRVEPNHHLWKECYIGRILPTGQFEIVASSNQLIKPLPWLGVEEETFATASVVIDLLQAVSQGIQYSWELEQQSNTLDRKNRKMAQYIEQVRKLTDAAAAVEQGQFDPLTLAEMFTRNDDLGQLARVFTHMVQTVQTRERELAEAKEQLEAVLNAVPGSICWISSNGVYIGVNRHLAESFNLTQADFVGQNVEFLKNNHNLANFFAQFVASSDISAETVIEIDLAHERRYYLVIAQKYQQGTATVSVGIDITDR
ncbi:MAG: transporter substrate-binding protein, partial [Oscillatoriales cyanobacterium C42_A2020_001]|nr:transporter substrate-binding protein [Leptolyngbyaceae cyanobacterium C42_A2020_001]